MIAFIVTNFEIRIIKGKTKGVKYQFENANYIIKVDMPSGYLRIYDKKAKATIVPNTRLLLIFIIASHKMIFI